MTTREYVSRLRSLGVELHAHAGRLHVSAPQGVLTAELQEELRTRKDEILELLEAEHTEPALKTRGPTLRPHGSTGRVHPCSYEQESLWYLSQLDADPAVYHTPAAWRLRGELDVRALEKALNEIRQRHAVLRTTFQAREGELAQVIRSFAPAPLPFKPMDGETDRDPEERLRSLLEHEIRRPFNLEEGPLIRWLLVRLNAYHHVLLQTAHHLVFDGESYQTLGRELATLYTAFKSGQPSPLPPPSLQYYDYARWQREWLRGDALERLQNWWRQRLGGDVPAAQLPTDHSRPAVQRLRGAVVRERLPSAVVDSVRRFAARTGTTPYMVYLAAFHALLHRYSGQSDLLVGTAVLGRGRQELEQMVGLLMNTVALRTDLSGDPSFQELAARVQRVCLDALEHQDLPFGKVVEAVRPYRSLSRGPLFQVLFRQEDSLASVPTLPGLEITSVEVERGATYCDVDFVVSPAGPETQVNLVYDVDLFDSPTAVRMLRHYRACLQGALADPERPLSRLSLVSQEERRQLLTAWNDTARDDGPPYLLHELVRRSIEDAPCSPMVVSNAGSVPASKLLERAQYVARALRARGLGPGARVGICVERGPDMLVALLGVLEAGAAYVPLDPALPALRLRFMIDDAALDLVLATRGAVSALPDDLEAEVILLDELERAAQAFAAEGSFAGAVAPEGPGPAPDSEGPAYVLYTSGSTGRPKGVVIPHRAAVNFLRSMMEAPGLRPDDRFLAVTTLSFDISLLELFLPLLSGSTLVIAGAEDAQDGQRLLQLIRDQGITVLQATPATWRMLIEAGWNGSPPLDVFCGGEALAPELARSLCERSEAVWNLYGPTETTVWSTRQRLRRGGWEDGPVPIGRPIANTRIYVLDQAKNPVPVGVAGDLWIGGAGVALGYHGRPELTAERFLPDPFCAEEDARMYYTGDLARWRRDGTLVCLGRTDHQVKLRGFRIELGEIEAALAELEEVKSAAVTVRTDPLQERRLAAYVVFRPGSALTASEVRERLRRILPDYMIPSLVVEMEALPIAPSGKIDRAALPDPTLAPDAVDRPDFIAPATPTEEAVAQVWQELLGVEHISADDNFFDLGGHSLLAMRAVFGMQEATGLAFEARSLVLQTLRQIAAAAEGDVEPSERYQATEPQGAGHP